MESVDSQNNTECPICYDTLSYPVKLACCKYRFCMKCLEGWKPGLESCVNGDRTCPCCRALIPPSLETFRTIQFYKRVTISLNIHLLQDKSVQLALPPFPNVEHLGPVAIRHQYKDMETTYGDRVRLFEQKYGFDFRNAIPSSPVKPLYLPINIVEAIRAENYLEVRKFLGFHPNA